MSLSRRDLLRTGWKVGASLLAIAAGWTGYEALRPLASNASGGQVRLGNPADVPPGTATYFNEGRLWLANADGRYFALSQKCPHLGCRVPFCESSGRFECPCHGSVFSIGGDYIAGPSPRGMDRYEVIVEDDELIADTTRLHAGPDAGEGAPAPARGPSCIEEG
jgi:cytochrome b6-f complex iron-sulfur subunit